MTASSLARAEKSGEVYDSNKEMSVDIIRVFKRAVTRHGDRVFCFDREGAITYEQADVQSNAIASMFIQEGISDGQTVALAAPDSIVLWLTIIGAWKAGALPALIDAQTPSDKLPYFVKDIGAKLAAAAPELHRPLKAAGADEIANIDALAHSETLESINRHQPDSPLYLSYTSGTTGPPKGVILSSAPVTLGTSCIADRLRLTHQDVLLATTPTSSSFQLVAALMPALHVGAAIGLVSGSAVDEIWEVARKWRTTVLVAYPLTLSDMVNAPQAREGESAFRLALSGGGPLAPRIKRDYRERLRIPLLESYGQSELGGFMVMGAPHDNQERAMAGYVGRPLPDRLAYIGGKDYQELPAGDLGEVMVAEGFFLEYRNKPNKTAETKRGGVLHTGDLGVSDKDDYIRVLGRVQESESARKRGGFLREVEDVVYEHQQVQHAAVVEGKQGEIRAYAELRDGCQAATDELERFVSERVTEDLMPAKVVLLERMPRTFSGKADRFILSQKY